MTHSKGPAEEVSLPPTRMRKDVSTANEGKNKAQGQVQANEQNQQPTADTPSPFARPGRQMIQYCKRQILPDHLAATFEDCEPRTPTRVLAAAIFSTLEKHLFDSTTPRAEVAANFSITAAQLHKAITGVDYKSGPHTYKKKKSITTETVTTTSTVKKTTPGPSLVSKEASITEQIPAEDTLASSSDSDSLYNPF